MALSSNTLIHLTMTKENLKGVLSDNFQVHHCKESVVLNGETGVFRVPMVSFCDIPLSEIKNHIKSYGAYGIGMTKKWGIKKSLNPVLYVEKNSFLAQSYKRAYMSYAIDLENDVDFFDDDQKAIADVLRYMKNYEADLHRQGTVKKNYRFSDEREWRYVPKFSQTSSIFVPEEVYEKDKDRFDAEIEDFRLEFEPNDIKYIIIKDDSEIESFIEHLRVEKGNKYSLKDIERLTTRILTTDQILTDI